MSYMDRNVINVGPVGAGALWAASHAPGIPGLVASAAQMGLRGWNVGQMDDIRGNLGMPGQSVGQWLGGILGLNNRGSLSGNNTVGAPGEFHLQNGQSPAVTLGGLYDNGGFFGRMLHSLIGGYADMQTSMTPDEARFFRYAGGPAPSAAAAPAAPGAAPVAITRSDGTIIGYYNPNDGSTSSAAAQNATAFGGGGAAGTPQGGQYGNNGVNTGGMAGPVNRNSSTGMLSRI